MIQDKDKLIQNILMHHSICSCYATQIDYTIQNYNNIYACHCFQCLKDNNCMGYSDNIISNTARRVKIAPTNRHSNALTCFLGPTTKKQYRRPQPYEGVSVVM